MSEPVKVYFEAPAAVEVEIAPGMTYNKIAPTKSVQRKIAEVFAAADSVDDSDTEAGVNLLAQMYDLLLKPCGANKKKASTFIKAQWDADAIATPEIIEHLERLGDVRPT